MLKIKPLNKLNKKEKKELGPNLNWFKAKPKKIGWGIIISMNDFNSSYYIKIMDKKEVIGGLFALKFLKEKNKFYHSSKDDICYELHSVYIEDKFKGKGYGKFLIKNTLDFLTSIGATKIFVEVNLAPE